MDKYLIELFDELNNKNVSYVVLRGYESLPYEISHDIDMGILEKDFKILIEILFNISDKYGYKKVFESKRKDFYQVYLYNECNGYCIKFDFWTNFTYKGLEYLKIDTILKNAKLHNNIKVLDNNLELLLSFLKEFLHNGWIREDKYNILKEKLNIYGFYNSKDSLYIENIDIENFINYLNTKKFNLKNESKKFIKQLFFKNIKYKGFFETSISLIDYSYKYLKEKLRKKSFFVVLIGPDGSGKTTLSKMLIDEIDKKISCFSSSYYIHGRFGILPNLSSLLGKNKEDTKEMKFEQVEKIDKINEYSKSRIILYMSYYFFDYVIGSFILFKKRFSNTLIVADRYFYDYFYQSTFKKYPKIFRFIYGMAPKPDVLIFLKADPAKIYKRKPELSIELLKEQQNSIEKLLRYNNLYYKSIIIDSSIDLNTTFKNIKKEILK